MLATGRVDATTDFSRMGGCDALISCVPTPLGRHLEPDLTFVRQTAEDIGRSARPGQLVVLESSTYPGTTREVMLPLFEKRGVKLGSDFFLAYSPEREDTGRHWPSATACWSRRTIRHTTGSSSRSARR